MLAGFQRRMRAFREGPRISREKQRMDGSKRELRELRIERESPGPLPEGNKTPPRPPLYCVLRVLVGPLCFDVDRTGNSSGNKMFQTRSHILDREAGASRR